MNTNIFQASNQSSDHISVGLDIGTTKIVALIGKKNANDKIEILGIGKAKSLGVHRGVVNNISQTIEAIEQAIYQAEEMSQLEVKNVIVGIAGQHIRSIEHSDYIMRDDFESVIDENDIKKVTNQVYKLAMLPGEEIIHVLPQEYKVDAMGEITEPIGMYGGRLEANFHVVIGQLSSIRNIGRCVKSASKELAGITLEPLASADAVLSIEEKEAGVALIDIGGGTTDIAIFKDGIIRHTAVIPYGGNVITEDIKNGCNIIQRQAEQLKIKYGSAWPGENKETEIVSIPGLRGRPHKEITLKQLSHIIHARVEDMMQKVFEELKKYGYEDKKKNLIAGIVLTGGGSKLKHIRQVTQFITGMDTRIGLPNEHLATGSIKELDSPIYSTSIGLVMRGFKYQKIEQTNEDLNQKKEELLDKENNREIEEKKRKTSKRNSKSFFEVWGEKFIRIINDTE